MFTGVTCMSGGFLHCSEKEWWIQIKSCSRKMADWYGFSIWRKEMGIGFKSEHSTFMYLKIKFIKFSVEF